MIGIIGIGSPFGSDCVAQYVIRFLKQNLIDNKIKNIMEPQYYDRPGVHLLEYLQKFSVVHLIDAMISGKPMGTIHRYEEMAVFEENNRLISSHGFGVAQVLSLGKVLNCLPKKIIIHGIEINDETLTRSVPIYFL